MSNKYYLVMVIKVITGCLEEVWKITVVDAIKTFIMMRYYISRVLNMNRNEIYVKFQVQKQCNWQTNG
jgi:hypothetical protein